MSQNVPKSNRLKYEVMEGWEQLPEGYKHRDVAGVAVDSADHVYLITRGAPRVMVYDRQGRFITSWGEGLFGPRAHGITVGPDDCVYCVDDGDHTVRKFTPTGQLLMTLGTSGVSSDTGYRLNEGLLSIKQGGPPFNGPTNVAIAPTGELYVSDGYGNARVHRFSADGQFIMSWGQPGSAAGHFRLPHDVCVASDGRVLVADRENDRIQIFSPDGEYLGEWTDVQRPSALFIGPEGLVYVAELPWLKGQWSFTHGLIEQKRPGRVSVLMPNGVVLLRWGSSEGCAAGDLCAPHGICGDSRGDIYVAEVTYSFASRVCSVTPGCHTLQKFVRKGLA